MQNGVGQRRFVFQRRQQTDDRFVLSHFARRLADEGKIRVVFHAFACAAQESPRGVHRPQGGKRRRHGALRAHVLAAAAHGAARRFQRFPRPAVAQQRKGHQRMRARVPPVQRQRAPQQAGGQARPSPLQGADGAFHAQGQARFRADCALLRLCGQRFQQLRRFRRIFPVPALMQIQRQTVYGAGVQTQRREIAADSVQACRVVLIVFKK